jgi:hypothetical protein
MEKVVLKTTVMVQLKDAGQGERRMLMALSRKFGPCHDLD